MPPWRHINLAIVSNGMRDGSPGRVASHLDESHHVQDPNFAVAIAAVWDSLVTHIGLHFPVRSR
jgi:hypothetical protein